MATTAATLHRAEFYVWSNNGAAKPDVLLHEFRDVADMTEANRTLRDLLMETPNAHYGHVGVPTWWNQNVRSNWMHRPR